MLMSLLYRQRAGAGLYFENPQLNATMTHMSHVVRAADGTTLGAGKLDPLQYGISALDRLYETADGWLCISVETDDEIQALRSVTQCGLLAECTSAQALQDNDYALGMELAAIFASRDTSSWSNLLDAAGVPAAIPKPFNNRAFMRDPENVRTRRVAVIAHPDEGYIREPDQYLRISDCAIPPHRLAPRLGQHSAPILRWLGMTAQSIERLQERGCVRIDAAAEKEAAV
jgi:crotonobetainyl-CoA:carnitine CoA-transferase CaiB-like acyl-CoA transferase